MLNRISPIITFLTLFAFITGCHDITKSEKFNREKWNQYYSFDGEDRYLMGEDLIKTHRLIGINNKKMLQLLGPPANYQDTTKTYYELSQEFNGIDPVSGKNLVITFNKDSIIVKAEIDEWHRN